MKSISSLSPTNGRSLIFAVILVCSFKAINLTIQILEDHISRVNAQLDEQEVELNKLKDMDHEKERLMAELKQKWTEMARNWAEELQKSRDEAEKLKAENLSAKEVASFGSLFAISAQTREHLKGKYHRTVDLLFDLF